MHIKPTVVIDFPIFTNNIRSYLLWSPVLLFRFRVVRNVRCKSIGSGNADLSAREKMEACLILGDGGGWGGVATPTI